MKKYKIIEDESDVVIGDENHVRIRVSINDEPKDRINLKFIRTTIEDFFLDITWDNEFVDDKEYEENKKQIKQKVIKILSDNSNELLNLIVSKALDDKDVKQQLKDREIGQFIVKPEHFGRKDYR